MEPKNGGMTKCLEKPLSIIKITLKKMAISPECFVCFQWDLQNWKDQSFNSTTGTEGITQLLKSNFEWPKCKWRHKCHTFAKKGTFFWTCPNKTFARIPLALLSFCFTIFRCLFQDKCWSISSMSCWSYFLTTYVKIHIPADCLVLKLK